MSETLMQAQRIASVVWGDTVDPVPPVPPPAPSPSPHPLIDLIMSIFSKLLPMLLTCLPVAGRTQRVTRMFNRQLRGHQAQLKQCIDEVCTEDDPKAAIHDAFLKVGKTITEPKVAALLDEAKG